MTIENNLARYRQTIVDAAVRRFTGDDIFPSDAVVLAVCEGLVDLLLEPAEARDPHVVRRFVEWVDNTIRRQGRKTDRTREFIDAFEDIVKRPLDNREDEEIDEFFRLCREFLQGRHGVLARNPT